jgi:MFS family permease
LSAIECDAGRIACTLAILAGNIPQDAEFAPAFASDFVPEHLRASGVGWYSTAVGVMQLVASLIAGALWDRLGHESVFFLWRRLLGARQRCAGLADPARA